MKTTYALSVLLNLALLTSIRALPRRACFLTSVPICSPSRSQSVQMNRALQYCACFLIFSAMLSLSCQLLVMESSKEQLQRRPYYVHILKDWHFKQQTRRARCPTFVLFAKLQACQMANDTGHRHFAVAPCSPKVEAEDIIFHILLAMNIHLIKH